MRWIQFQISDPGYTLRWILVNLDPPIVVMAEIDQDLRVFGLQPKIVSENNGFVNERASCLGVVCYPGPHQVGLAHPGFQAHYHPLRALRGVEDELGCLTLANHGTSQRQSVSQPLAAGPSWPPWGGRPAAHWPLGQEKRGEEIDKASVLLYDSPRPC